MIGQNHIHRMRNHARGLVHGLFGYPVITDVNRTGVLPGGRRALLVYLTDPFLLRPDDRRLQLHQNMMQNIQIAGLLGEAGYVVDVADVSDRRHHPAAEYDLVISHRADLQSGRLNLRSGVTLVYLASGMNHAVHNRNLRARYARLRERRGCDLAPATLNSECVPFATGAHAVAGFGNESTVGTWSACTKAKVFPFNNYGCAFGSGKEKPRDSDKARRNFLYFASRDQVAKGLDLLLEIFPRYPTLHLYVCSLFRQEKKFCACYAKELFHTDNIHPVRVTGAADSVFQELLRRCSCIVHPSCSEGQPGSVLHAMHGGLVPLVTKESGIDTGEFGVTFPGDDIDLIESALLSAAGMPAAWHEEHSTRTVEAARLFYSEDAFLRRWKDIVAEVTGERFGRNP